MRDQLDRYFTLRKIPAEENVDAWLGENGAAITGIATNGQAGVKPEIMSALPNLRVISSYGVGYESIDVEAASARGIIVCHTPDVVNNDVANTAIMLMLAVSRRLIRDVHWAHSGLWAKKGMPPVTRSIEGKNVGILGLGRIGETLARKLQAFDCNVVYHSRNKRDDVKYRYFEKLPDMAEFSDYLVAVIPGSSDTDKLINRDVIDRLGPNGTLINISRGSVVDEMELVLALKEGRLGAAGLDVFEKEPQIPADLIEMENVVLTPHIASATVETRQAMGDRTVENLVRFFEEGVATSPVPECM